MKITIKKIILTVGIVILILLGGVYIMKHQSSNPQEPESQQAYVIKKGIVYYRTIVGINDGAGGYSTKVDDYEMKGVDAKTFTAFDLFWAKDKKNIFYMEQMVLPEEGTAPVDTSSFTMIEDSGGVGKDTRGVYIASQNESGWTYRLIPEVDPATFTFVSGKPYAKDAKNVYYLDLPFEVRKIEGADASSFAVLGQCAAVEVYRAYYAWDANSVIAGDKIIEGADRNTFSIVASYDNGYDGMYFAGTYAVDKNRVYKNCGEITQGNPATCSAHNLKECE